MLGALSSPSGPWRRVLFFVTAVSAVIPSLLLIWYFWARDAQPEPGRVLWATFGLGVLSIIPVLMIELPLTSLLKHLGDPWLRAVLDGFIGAAAPEEGLKLAVLLLYCERHPAFDEPMDGIVYGSVASLGFATLENVLYIGKGGLGVAALRAVTAVPGHAFYGAILGYYVGQAKFFPAHRGRLILRGYLLAVALHGLYDAPLMYVSSFKHHGDASGLAQASILLTLAALVFSWRFVVRQIRRLRIDQLHVMAVRALQAGLAPPPGVLTAAPVTTGSQVAGGVLIALGGLLASGGGLVVLAVGLAILFGKEEGEGRLKVILGGGLIGGLPLMLGVALFAMGIRRFKARAPLSPYVARAAR
jgi:RsiW-degrading membrane proteinase PrsW (M82 family)